MTEVHCPITAVCLSIICMLSIKQVISNYSWQSLFRKTRRHCYLSRWRSGTPDFLIHTSKHMASNKQTHKTGLLLHWLLKWISSLQISLSLSLSLPHPSSFHMNLMSTNKKNWITFQCFTFSANLTLPLLISSSSSTEYRGFFGFKGDSEDKWFVSQLKILGFFTTVPLNASRRRGEVSVPLFFTRRHVAVPTRYTSKKYHWNYQYSRKAGNFNLVHGIALSQDRTQDKTWPANLLPLQKGRTWLYYVAN